MKKKAIKKLHLSRETLFELESSDSQKVAGGTVYSPDTGAGGACCTLTVGTSACEPICTQSQT